MDNTTLSEVLGKIDSFVTQFEDTAVDKIAKDAITSPFKVLIATLISSRTKDDVTHAASLRLFSQAPTPKKMLELSEEEIRELIYPAGFYKNKAKFILKTSRILIENYGGKVPNEIDELVQLPGVGRKTANLVKGLAFHEPAICVDTHVHRISNRLGYVSTNTPEETEYALRDRLHEKYWIPINNWLVSYGQKICAPISPFCSKCVVENYCPKIGVTKSR